MHYRKYLTGVVIVMAFVLFSPDAFALNIGPADGKWYRVTEPAQEGPAQCEISRSTWKVTVSWKPIVYQNQPWSKYTVGGYKCAQKVPVNCTATRCSAEITGCQLPVARTWVFIIAEVGRNGGVRVSGFSPSLTCK
jgi:hypothetical protein